MALMHELIHGGGVIGQVSAARMAEITAAVTKDRDRFVKWATRPNQSTAKSWRRTLPDGEFEVFRR